MHLEDSSTFKRRRVCLAIGSSAVLALSACALDTQANYEETTAAEPLTELQQDYLDQNHAFHDSEVVLEWNELAVDTANEVDEFLSLRAHRTVAMAHLAAHDALNSIVPVYETYAHFEPTGPADGRVAVSRAMKDVLVDAYPDHAEAFIDLHDQWLSKTDSSSSLPVQNAEQLGADAAAAIITLREGDNTDLPPVSPYEPGDQPGDYQFTPPFDFAFGENWGKAEPFAMKAQDQFRGTAPPALDSAEYAETFAQVKALGRLDSDDRTDDQTHIAHWWAEFAETWFPRLGRQLVRDHDISMWDSARLYALFSMDNFDGYVAIFEAKFHYDFWRPATAILEADTDGNPDTRAAPGWESEMESLPFPDHPSAHQQACAGAAEVFSHVLGTSDVSFTMDSLTAPDFGPATRSYDNINDASDDCGLSRVYNGFHFSTAVDAGEQQGRARAGYIIDNFLQPAR